jgi:transposase InsO family protein
MSLRLDFVTLAAAPDANVRELCRRFHLSSRTAYKWIGRYAQGGPPALANRSRRPLEQPRLTGRFITAQVLKMRRKHPAWGGLKIRARLLHLGHSGVPAASTITEILRRYGLLDPALCAHRRPFKRFVHAAPNDLWQLDFKGHFALEKGRCHPLTAVDDHSRYALLVEPCADEQGSTVQTHLRQAFQHCGLPWRILSDNGAPWGCSGGPDSYTKLGVWLMRLGVQLIHGRPVHPQTQGKEERFNRTLKAELLCRQHWRDLPQCQHAFAQWRAVYNHERPHQAIGLKTPAQLYRPSPRALPAQLPAIDYGPGDIVKKVKCKGEITYANQFYYIGRAFSGLPIALRATAQDGAWDLYFCQQKIGRIDRTQKAENKWIYQSVRP